MNKDDVIDSLGRIDDHVIQKVNNARMNKGHKRICKAPSAQYDIFFLYRGREKSL